MMHWTSTNVSPAGRHAMALSLRHGLVAAGLVLAAGLPAQAQPYVNVTIGGAFAPGVYGQIVLGNNPLPPLINAVPVIVGPPVLGAGVMYIYAPEVEYRDWARYCSRYGACGHPVHFVRVDRGDPWWTRRSDYLRGPGQYWSPPPRAGWKEDHDRGARRRGPGDERGEGRRDRGERRGDGR